jgi:ABC-type transport system involved in multi-copper enzyme maturation permease subunit
MIGLLRAEGRKFFSTRIWWVLLLVGVGYIGLMSALMAAAFGSTGADLPADERLVFARMCYLIGSTLGYALPALVGALAVTTEFRHKTLTPTFLAEPRRWRVLAAKLVAALPVGAAFGLAITATSVGLGGGVLAAFGYPTGLDDAQTWALIARCVLSLTLWAVVGVGLGTLIPNQVASIVVLLVFTQFIEPAARLIPTMIGRPIAAINYLPGAIGDAVTGDSFYSAIATTGGTGVAASPAVSFLPAVAILIGYGLVFAIMGHFLQLRRDIS